MANFDSIAGQKNAKKLLNSAIKNDKIAHAYLFTGQESLGKFTLAIEFAAIIQCQSETSAAAKAFSDRRSRIKSGTDPDVLVIDPENNDKEGDSASESAISVDEIRKLEHHLSLFPYNSQYKIAIINNAHKFTAEAANAFLKTLEEPRGNSIIILIAENRHSLAETLVSRAQIIRFWPVKSEVIEDYLVQNGFDGKNAARIASFSRGRPGLAISLARDKKKFSGQAGELENFWRFITGSLEDKFFFAEKTAKGDEKINSILKSWLMFSREMILAKYLPDDRLGSGKIDISSERLLKFAKGLNLTINLINNSNVNKKLALENLALEI